MAAVKASPVRDTAVAVRNADVRIHSASASSWQLSPKLCGSYPSNASCTPSGRAWVDHSLGPNLAGSEVCAALRSQNVSSIFCGSATLLRNAYEALVLILSEDYEYGTLDAVGQTMPQCAGDGQFDNRLPSACC